jgi:hypothetical protein
MHCESLLLFCVTSLLDDDDASSERAMLLPAVLQKLRLAYRSQVVLRCSNI